MSVVRFSVSLVAIIGLLLTDPVRSADAASELVQGNLSPFVSAVGDVLLDALQGLFKYL
jgi:hypothetical protein